MSEWIFSTKENCRKWSVWPSTAVKVGFDLFVLVAKKGWHLRRAGVGFCSSWLLHAAWSSAQKSGRLVSLKIICIFNLNAINAFAHPLLLIEKRCELAARCKTQLFVIAKNILNIFTATLPSQYKKMKVWGTKKTPCLNLWSEICSCMESWV